MNDETLFAMTKASPSVSPYLLRPLRSHAQALADIAEARKPAGTVTRLAPLAMVDRKRETRRNSDIAA